MHVSLFTRKRALALLARGLTVDAVVQELAKRHPYHTPEEIRRAYFVLGGKFTLKGLEGADRQRLVAKLREMNEFRQKLKDLNAERLRSYTTDEQQRQARDRAYRAALADPKKKKRMAKTLTEMWKRPAFKQDVIKQSTKTITELNKQAGTKEAAAKRLKDLHKQPEYAQAHSKRSSKLLKKKQSNREFIKARDVGLQKYYDEHPEIREARRKLMQQINEERRKLREALKADAKKPSRILGMTRQQREQRLRELDIFYNDILRHIPKEERHEYLKRSQKIGQMVVKTEQTPAYAKARAEFMKEQHLSETVLMKMENTLKQAHKGRQGKNLLVLAKAISQEAKTPYLKAYIFAVWALINKWPELTQPTKENQK